MIDWIHKKQQNTNLKRANELALRRSLAEKISNLKSNECAEEDDYTVVSINGKKLRVHKEQITISGVG